MTETSTDPAATLRRAARVAHTVGLPAVTAQFLAAEYRALAASWGPVDGNWSEYSTLVASAREVLALAEQHQARPGSAWYLTEYDEPYRTGKSDV